MHLGGKVESFDIGARKIAVLSAALHPPELHEEMRAFILATRDETDPRHRDWKPHASLHEGVDVTPWLGKHLRGFSIETRHKLNVLTLLSGKEKYPPAASFDDG